MLAQLSTSEGRPPAASRAGGRPALIVVLNPGSGAQSGRELREQIAEVFQQAGRACEFQEPSADGLVAACQRAARRARERGGVLVAVGGDGTINSAAQAALSQGCALGVIAQGTFNFFAREHGLPLDAGEAARALLVSAPQPVQVGLVNQRLFLVNASLGLYPRLLEDREALKQQLGRRRWVALLAGLITLLGWRRQLALEIELDGQIHRVRTATLFVGNNRLQLDRVGIDPSLAERAGRGALVALAPHPVRGWAKLRLVLRALFGRLGASEELDSFALRSLNVVSARTRRVDVATDGEVLQMQLPLRFAVSPKPLLLMKPTVRADRERGTADA